MSFTYLHYDIYVVKNTDNVTIKVVDTKLFKTYQKIYDNRCLSACNLGNIDSFYNSVSICFGVLAKDGVGKINDASVRGFDVKKNKLEIYMGIQGGGITCKIHLLLPVVEGVKVTNDHDTIKKLQEELNELKNLVSNLEIPICDMYVNGNGSDGCYNAKITVPIKCPVLTIYRTVGSNTYYRNDYKNDYSNILHDNTKHLAIYMPDMTKINENFKKINVQKVYIEQGFDTVDLTNFPSTITHLYIMNNSVIKKISGLRHLKNLKVIIVSNCGELSEIENFTGISSYAIDLHINKSDKFKDFITGVVAANKKN